MPGKDKVIKYLSNEALGEVLRNKVKGKFRIVYKPAIKKQVRLIVDAVGSECLSFLETHKNSAQKKQVKKLLRRCRKPLIVAGVKKATAKVLVRRIAQKTNILTTL